MLADADFQIQDHGSVVIFAPLTANAEAAMEEMDIQDWQWIGAGFAVDRRIARDLIAALLANGLIVE